MKKLFALALVSASLVSPLGADGAAIVGYVSDTKCAMSAGAGKKTAAEWIDPSGFENCVKDCLTKGSKAVFVTEDNRILQLDAASLKKVTPFLGHKVSVTGRVGNGTIQIDRVTDLKLK